MSHATTEAGEVSLLTLTAQEPKKAQDRFGDESIPYVLIPSGHQVQDLEKLFTTPSRRRGAAVLRDVASFIAIVNIDKTNSTRLYGTTNPPKFTAVFNDHGPDLPGWRDHTATYACPLSVEWQTWSGMNKKAMTQEQFAQFIEDNAPDCVNPPAADMIEIARTLEAKKKVNFASGIRLSNGQNELTYEEEISGTAGKGKFMVPEAFTIGIPVLEGGAPYALSVRLRYRIADGGKLSMWYDLERPHKVLEHAVQEVWQHIATETQLPIFNGG